MEVKKTDLFVSLALINIKKINKNKRSYNKLCYTVHEAVKADINSNIYSSYIDIPEDLYNKFLKEES